MSIKEKVGRFFGRRINERGQEVPDPTPVALPIGYKAPPSLEERIRSMIQFSLSQQAARDGFETWQEANDFTVDETDPTVFTDEDDLIAPNDPHVQRAFEEEVPKVRERLDKAKKEKEAKAAPPPAPAAPSAPPAPAPNQ